MDIVDKVVVDFHAATKKLIPLRSAAEAGRYASRVRIVSTEAAPTSFAGVTGVVARIHDDGNVFVRMQHQGREVVLPFGKSQLEVIA